jgi:hypothetical protein
VRYKGAGEAVFQSVTDFKNALPLKPGLYEFTAEAAGFAPQKQPISIEPNRTAQIKFFLIPATPVVEKNTAFFNPADVVKLDNNWYTGKSKALVPVTTSKAVNAVVFLKNKVKKMTWQIALDDDNALTYTIENNKGLSIGKVIGGAKSHNNKTEFDMSGTAHAAGSYVAVIHLESNGVRVTMQDGTEVDKTSDAQHDWRRARISIKGDATFTVMPGGYYVPAQ